MSLHTEILSAAQVDMLPKLTHFATDFYLVGGTALALQLGHRQSIDFDFFTRQNFDNQRMISWVEQHLGIAQVRVNQAGQLTLNTKSGVQLTWYRYDWEVPHSVVGPAGLLMPDPLHIGCMKAFALGQRAKWKDYVDLYFLFQQFSLKQLVECSVEIFSSAIIDEALLRGQLSYFADIDYSEQVTFMPPHQVTDEQVKKFLSEVAVS